MNNLSLAIENVTRSLAWNSPTTWIATLASLIFLGLGLRSLLDPAGSATLLGLPAPDVNGLAFVQVYGARNIGLSLLALILIFLDIRAGLAALFVAAAVISGMDAWIVTTHAGVEHAIKHFAYFTGLMGFALWLMFRS